MKIKNRDHIDGKYKWNIERMYPIEDRWDEDMRICLKAADDFTKYEGHVAESSAALLSQLEDRASISRRFENIFVYARQRRDEDNSNDRYVAMVDKVMSCGASISAKISFFIPELLECDEKRIISYVDDEPNLKTYSFMLRSLFKDKAHVLSKSEERIMASLGEVLGAPNDIFSMLNDVDMDFGEVKNDNGDTVKLTHGNFTALLESNDRTVRKNVFENMYNHYKSLNNTISVMYNFNVKENAVNTRLRKYDNACEAALSSEEIPIDVYRNLIASVHDHLPSMYRYMELRKRVLGFDNLKMYDMYKPLVKPPGLTCTYEQAVNIACDALRPLGKDYVARFRQGVTDDRWVDIYENSGKTSGAYSFGSYDSYPYILLNFNGEIRDIFTLIHEGGHSMHSLLTRENQPFIYGGHSIFTAETASTVNETLLINYLIEELEEGRNPLTGEEDLSEDEVSALRTYLVNFYVDEYKSTLYRQTMFAEFELMAHEHVESGESLTAEWLNTAYDDLNTLYFGPALSHDDYIQYEWSRIPHFYRPFYVYQYATGYSGANAIAGAILGKFDNLFGHNGYDAAEDYLDFLKSGNSEYPINLLKRAGIDMSTRVPIDNALDNFDKLVRTLESLL